jgi:signal transduction histidine kinase/thiol-disulfide isomerase/thioredoxin
LRITHRWLSWPGWLDLAWVAFSLADLVAIVILPQWETIPFHFIWISFTFLYGFRVWAIKPTLWVLTVVIVMTFTAIAMDVWRGAEPPGELTEVPLMAAMFGAMVWHARRRLSADKERHLVSEENVRLLGTQRRFLQDASHQLRTPITIALGHAELLAEKLASQREGHDIQIVVGELTRLRRLGEQLLLIAASEDPDFLHPEPVALERFTMDVLRRWRPTARRCWQLGRLDEMTVYADRERLGLAMDALLENAVRHTREEDTIQMSVISGEHSALARMIIADTGTGIPANEVAYVFDRFRTGDHAVGARGTGLGLTLVRAVARAHGGEVRVRSTQGAGSEFELLLPSQADRTPVSGLPPQPATDDPPATGLGKAASVAGSTPLAPLDEQLAPLDQRRGGIRAMTEPYDDVAGDAPTVSGVAGTSGRNWMAAARSLTRGQKLASGVIAVGLVTAVVATVLNGSPGRSHAAAGAAVRAPGFALTAVGRAGPDVSLAAYAGRPVIVNFFASWCGPCQKETPLLARFYQSMHGSVAIVGVDVNDGVSEALTFMRRAGVRYPVGSDPRTATADSYGVSALPQTFFLDPARHIVRRVFGAVSQSELNAGTAAMDGG